MKKKTIGLLLLLLFYVVSFALGFLVYHFISPYMGELLALFIANTISTVILWIIGIFLKSASVYDPYWSVQTVIYYVFLMIKYHAFNAGVIIYLCLILFWAIRLTTNFAIGFNDLSYIDWRYKNIKEKTGKFFQIVSLIGIHMIPTVIVYLASIPAFMYILSGYSFTAFNLIGLIIMFFATLLEMTADIEMKKFIKNRTSRSEINRNGVWKNTRHPNYLGEISFWYGVLLVYLIPSFSNIYVIIGAILNTLLFLFISIPLAEGNMQKYKENFDQYKKETWMLLILPGKHSSNKETIESVE